MNPVKSAYFLLREQIRCKPVVAKGAYLLQSLSITGMSIFKQPAVKGGHIPAPAANSVALCCRIRDEARYLPEFLEYYLAAGVEHFFFYEKLSADNFVEVLEPYIQRGVVTLFSDWPFHPVSPAAEHDCLNRAAGRFRWVGLIDLDEFVVIRNQASIPEFLSSFQNHPGVTLCTYIFGSNGHKERPADSVVKAYDRRADEINPHVKCFIQPNWVLRNRNCHSWYFRRVRVAVNENRRPVLGSLDFAASASHAWINHYHLKSEQDYLEKASKRSVVDAVSSRYGWRSDERRRGVDSTSNAVVDRSAQDYLSARLLLASESALSADVAVAS